MAVNKPILCVNLNAAIDKTVVVNDFQLDQIYRPDEVLALAGGKGCNVARVLNTLGAEPIVTGWVGGHAGNFIESELHKEGITTSFVHTQRNARTCLSIIDSVNHTLTELYEHGNPVENHEIDAFIAQYRQLIPQVELVVLSGSVPPQVPRDINAQLIHIAKDNQVRTILDTSGDSLKLGLDAQPFLVKPNQHELSILLGREFDSINDYIAGARQIADNYNCRVVLSLGQAGAIGIHHDKIYQVTPPPVKAISAVGSGDALVAGLAYALQDSDNFISALKLAVACGTANTLSIGAGRLNLEDVNRIKQKTVIKP